MEIASPHGFCIFIHIFPSISTATIWENSTQCIKPLRNTLLAYVDTTILSPHLDSLKIHVVVLDEEMLTPIDSLGIIIPYSKTWKCDETVGLNPRQPQP